jgi:membrane-associated protease RseP (regulator of RpoE activity)
LDTLLLAIIVLMVAWSIIAALAQRFNLADRNIEVAPFQIVVRTQRLTGAINNIAQKARPFWKVYAFVGLIIGVGAMVLTTSNFLFVGRMLLGRPSSATGVQLVIPGVTLPLVYSLIGLVTVVVVHEFSHGIIARLRDIPLKSVGVGILAILPFAFVEPDEEGMEHTTPRSRSEVYAAGSMANITLAFIAFAIIFLAIIPQLSATGLAIANVEPGTPAEAAGLEKGMVIQQLTYDGTMYDIESYDAFSNIMDATRAGSNIELVTDQGTFSFELASHPERDIGYIGVQTYDRSQMKSINPLVAFLYPPIVLGIDPAVFPEAFSSVSWTVIKSLEYIFFLNVGIGLFNMLPIGPLDGGRIFREAMDKLFPDNVARSISVFVSVLIVVLIVASLVVPYIM